MTIYSDAQVAEIRSRLEQARRDAARVHEHLMAGTCGSSKTLRSQFFAHQRNASQRIAAELQKLLDDDRCTFCFKHASAPHTAETRNVHSAMAMRTGHSHMCRSPQPAQV
jgi:hypothetical protein